MLRSKHLKFFLPLFLVMPLMFGVAVASTQTQGIKIWIKDHESIITILLALAIPLTGWIYSKHAERLANEQKAGREQFLNQATNKISGDITSAMVPKIDLLEERIDWLYKQQTDIEKDLHIIENAYSDIRLNLSELNADVRILNAVRKEEIAKLTNNLQTAEGQLDMLLQKFDKPILSRSKRERIGQSIMPDLEEK